MRLALLAILLIVLIRPADAWAYKRSGGLPTDGLPATVSEFIASLPSHLQSKELEEALNDSGTNWQQLAAVLRMAKSIPPIDENTDLLNHSGFTAEDVVWLIVNASHLDRLELSFLDLTATLIDAGLAVRWMGHESSSELWRRYILNYRFDDEPVSNWRTKFYSTFVVDLLPVNQETIQRITSQATAGFTIIERGYFGNLSDPVSLLQSRAGTKRELSILVAAALRSQGYATRFVRENRSGESWVEVYSGDPQEYDASAWTPVYPTAPERTGDVAYATELCGGRITVVTAGDAFGREQVTSRYSQLVRVKPVFKRDGMVDSEFTGFAITAWNEKTGGYVPLDDLEYPSSDKDYPLDEAQQAEGPTTFLLGPGDYRLEWGVRYPGGISHVGTHDFVANVAEDPVLISTIDPPADLPQTALVERELGEFADSEWLMRQGRYVFLVGDQSEPTLRALEALFPLIERSSVNFLHWKSAMNEESRVFIRDVLKIDLEKDSLPVVIVVVDGETRMYLRGYNLNVAQWVERALEDQDNINHQDTKAHR